METVETPEEIVETLGESRLATRGGGGSPPLPLFENKKKCPDFGGKKMP